VFLGLVLLPVPIQLPPLGTFYLAPPIGQLSAASIPQATGRAVQTLAIPPIPDLIGVALHLQAAIQNTVNPTGDLHLTGWVADPVLR
jgi:hypothetical protein